MPAAVTDAPLRIVLADDQMLLRAGVARRNGVAVVEVADDGIGGVDASRGSGLRGLRDRIEALGGRFGCASGDGAGTVVHAEIPCG